MQQYSIILFDLDGTISDPKVGITKSVQYALAKMGINEPDRDSLTAFIGPPLQESFEQFYHMDSEMAGRAIGFYREYFSRVGIYENTLYSGVVELLQKLTDRGKAVVLATSKPTIYSQKILEYFNIASYFSCVVGSHLDGTRSSKTEIIAHIGQKYPQYPKASFIMIGDRKHDVVGARHYGIDSIAVSYGYGTVDELIQAHPTYLVNHIEDLTAILW